jgi:hypothetical protein
MADDVTETQVQTGGEPGSNANTSGTGGGTAPQNAGTEPVDRAFSQADVDRIVRERLAEEQRRQQKKAEEEEAKRRGDFEKLLADRDTELAQTRAELAKERHEVLKARVAAKHQLPAELAARLHGETEAELEQDAKELAKFAKPNSGLPPAGGRNPGQANATSSPEKTKQQLRAGGHYRL